ncbi:MAG: sulfite exporter TauE/SafE family protein [Caulobacterales bacterium]|nr:sulfite exporter TauE/SafE family protein [Caulobacterales bacterium]
MPLPPDIGPAFAGLLIAASFLTSALTAAFGLGGGVSLLAVMASGMPVATVIPLHGVVQLGSNAGRAVVQRAHILWPMVAWMGAGTVLGAAIGGASVTALPDGPLKIAIGLFILAMTWAPKPPALGGRAPVALAAGGAVSGGLTMFFGATGPFVSALLAACRLDRMTLVGTFSACMVVQHLVKIAAFGFLGFAFGPWLALLAVMIAAGFAGTLLGSRVLAHMPERVFQRGLRAIITVLALHLIAAGAGLSLW